MKGLLALIFLAILVVVGAAVVGGAAHLIWIALQYGWSI